MKIETVRNIAYIYVAPSSTNTIHIIIKKYAISFFMVPLEQLNEDNAVGLDFQTEQGKQAHIEF
jgi:hypothetical protein